MKRTILFPMMFLFVLPLLLFAGTPIEDHAIISRELKGKTQTLEAMVTLVKAYGYRCDSISAARPMVWSRGYTLVCNGFHYEYEIKDKGGQWLVTVK